jgi:hypothetical protein
MHIADFDSQIIDAGFTLKGSHPEMSFYEIPKPIIVLKEACHWSMHQLRCI